MTAAAVPADDWTPPAEEPRGLRLVEPPEPAEEELGEHIVLGYN
ncbi:hypothetical protein QRX60_51185 [Amycolatopsis mongoliensis]|uniref:Uncharacterized protein n=1 Tax=Amycolatopsis mongoliensis TaxID=715475 RepID=A0A9Y2JRD2_9PSEU|nr:hypothetical protein [Amycolatopsis sp. 4-36]WIY02256.1 hypothetical protein QRX60_51185 [Amycolatopsis sp. 4-36]